jgi:hypothetical protein
MQLLIVEGNSFLAEITAELRRSLDPSMQQFEAIPLAADLQTAMLCLPEQDAVLGDRMFPVSADCPLVWGRQGCGREAPAGAFTLSFTVGWLGSIGALNCARASDTPALAKPAPTEEIYEALTHHWSPTYSQGYGKSALIAQTPNMATEKHLQNA